MSQSGIAVIQNSNIPGDVATSYVTDAGTAVPVAHVLLVNGTGGLSTSVGLSNQILVSGSASFPWMVVTSASNPVTLSAHTGYITKGAGVVDFVLPAAAAIGDTFRIIGYGNLWTIAQNAGQSIRFGSQVSTAGVFGAVTATMVTDCLDIVCVTANLDFYCPDGQGNPNFT